VILTDARDKLEYAIRECARQARCDECGLRPRHLHWERQGLSDSMIISAGCCHHAPHPERQSGGRVCPSTKWELHEVPINLDMRAMVAAVLSAFVFFRKNFQSYTRKTPRPAARPLPAYERRALARRA
jgi:hypothetical protein